MEAKFLVVRRPKCIQKQKYNVIHMKHNIINQCYLDLKKKKEKNNGPKLPKSRKINDIKIQEAI